MRPKGLFLNWVVVKEIKKSIDFYTQTLGFTLHEFNEEFGWAELSAGEGSRLGLHQAHDQSEIQAGNNAVITIEVANIEEAIKELIEQETVLVGKMIEISGHVKMQSFKDKDSNVLQLVEMCEC